MARRLTSRVGIAGAALAFAVSGGVAGEQVHPLSAHDAHSLATPVTESGSHRGATAGDHVEHHRDGPLPSSSGDCTCLGPCQGGGAPTLPEATLSQMSLPDIGNVQLVSARASSVDGDPTAYLFPLPDPPPST